MTEDTALYTPPSPAPMEVTIITEHKNSEYVYVMFPSGKMAYVKSDTLFRHTKEAV